MTAPPGATDGAATELRPDVPEDVSVDVPVPARGVTARSTGAGTALKAPVSKVTVAALGAAMTVPRARLGAEIRPERPVDIGLRASVVVAAVSTLEIPAGAASVSA